MKITDRRACALLVAGACAMAGCTSPPLASTPGPLATVRAELRQAGAGEPLRAATRPEALDRALLPPLQIEPAPAAPAPEPRFDLSVANAPAQQVFVSIASGSRYSMLVTPEVSGNITVNLKNVTVREALDALRDLYGYEYRIQGTRIFIQPNTLQTRIFQVNYLAGKRTGATDMRVTSGSITNAVNPANAALGVALGTTSTPIPGTTSGPPSSRIATETDNDFWSELRSTLATIVGTEDNRKVIVNPLSGVIAVRGFPVDIRNAENYLRMTQLIIERQVMIEAKIIEVQLSDSTSSGVNWAAFHNGSSRTSGGIIAPGTVLQPNGPIGTGGTGVDPTTGQISDPLLAAIPGLNLASSGTNVGSLFGLAFQAKNFAALLQFLETQGQVQVLSSPRIATLNNQKAVLKVGTDEFFVTSVSTSTTTSASNAVTSPTIGVQPFFSGIALDVTPQIDDSESIILHLHPSVSVVNEKQKNVNLGTLGSFQLPLAASTVSESDSIVRVQDGQIVAIGGLMRQKQEQNASGLPGATGNPVLGTILGGRETSHTKSELVMLLKPTIIREGGRQNETAEIEQRLGMFDARPPATGSR